MSIVTDQMESPMSQSEPGFSLACYVTGMVLWAIVSLAFTYLAFFRNEL